MDGVLGDACGFVEKGGEKRDEERREMEERRGSREEKSSCRLMMAIERSTNILWFDLHAWVTC